MDMAQVLQVKGDIVMFSQILQDAIVIHPKKDLLQVNLSKNKRTPRRLRNK